MPGIFKTKNLNFTENPKAIAHFKLQTAIPRLSETVKASLLDFDIRLLNPDQYSFPYHFHRHAEELMMIISGSLTLRTKEGFQIVEQGEIIFFETGEGGVHQFYNHTKAPSTYLDIKTSIANDVCEYPDSGKIAVSMANEIYEKNTYVDYFKGEENIKSIWESLNTN